MCSFFVHIFRTQFSYDASALSTYGSDVLLQVGCKVVPLIISPSLLLPAGINSNFLLYKSSQPSVVLSNV